MLRDREAGRVVGNRAGWRGRTVTDERRGFRPECRIRCLEPAVKVFSRRYVPVGYVGCRRSRQARAKRPAPVPDAPATRRRGEKGSNHRQDVALARQNPARPGRRWRAKASALECAACGAALGRFHVRSLMQRKRSRAASGVRRRRRRARRPFAASPRFSRVPPAPFHCSNAAMREEPAQR